MIGSLITSPYYDQCTGNLTGQVPEILTRETRDEILEKFASSMNRKIDDEIKKIEKKLYDKLRKTCNPNRVRKVASKGNTYSYPNSLYNVYMKTYSLLDTLNVGPPRDALSEQENQVKMHAKDPGHECYLMWPQGENFETLKAVAMGVVNCKRFICISVLNFAFTWWFNVPYCRQWKGGWMPLPSWPCKDNCREYSMWEWLQENPYSIIRDNG